MKDKEIRKVSRREFLTMSTIASVGLFAFHSMLDVRC